MSFGLEASGFLGTRNHCWYAPLVVSSPRAWKPSKMSCSHFLHFRLPFLVFLAKFDWRQPPHIQSPLQYLPVGMPQVHATALEYTKLPQRHQVSS